MRSRHPAENDPAAWLTVWGKKAALSLAIWTRYRICLGYREQDWMPTLEEKMALATSVLGLKRLAIAQSRDDTHIRSVFTMLFQNLQKFHMSYFVPTPTEKKLIPSKTVFNGKKITLLTNVQYIGLHTRMRLRPCILRMEYPMSKRTHHVVQQTKTFCLI